MSDWGPFSIGEVVTVVKPSPECGLSLGDEVTIASEYCTRELVHGGYETGWELKERHPKHSERTLFAPVGSVRRRKPPSWDEVYRLTGYKPEPVLTERNASFFSVSSG